MKKIILLLLIGTAIGGNLVFFFVAHVTNKIEVQQLTTKNDEAELRQKRMEELNARNAEHKPFENDMRVKRERGFGQ